MYDIFLSYSQKDTDIASLIYKKLEKAGLSVFFAPNSIHVGDNFVNQISDAISSSKIIIIIVSENSINSIYVKKEMSFALSIAESRAKVIIPIKYNCSYDMIKNDAVTSFSLSAYQFLELNSAEDIDNVVEKISMIGANMNKKNSLSEKLTEYLQVGAREKATETICELLDEIIRELKENKNGINGESRFPFYKQCILYMQKLTQINDFDCSDNGRKLAHRKIDTINSIGRFTDECSQYEDLLTNAFAVMSIYYDREIRTDCAESLTYGDVNSVSNYYGVRYEDRQAPFVKVFESIDLLKLDSSEYTADMISFIKEAYGYIYKQKTEHIYAETESDTDEDEKLKAIASFIQEGNRLFYALGDSNLADEFLRCLLLSFERLKNYCTIIGETEICAECIDRIFEIKKRLEKKQLGNSSEKASEGIKSLLGLTIPKSGNFDVFLCHKSEDYDIAEQMYYFFRSNLKEAFLDKKSLPLMSESQYRNAIMEVLDKTTHFIVIISNLEYLKSKWVALEMDIFQTEIDEGRKNGSNFIIVTTNNVYDEIIKSNKTILPLPYRRCEIIKVDEYQNRILGYLK